MHLLVARDRQRAGERSEARILLRQALAGRPALIFRPIGSGVLLWQLLPRRSSAALDQWLEAAIRRYRRARFDYRYARRQ